MERFYHASMEGYSLPEVSSSASWLQIFLKSIRPAAFEDPATLCIGMGAMKDNLGRQLCFEVQ